MELENVIKLINAVSESSLTSFSMEDGDTKLSLGADRSDRAAVKDTAGADDIVNSDSGNESGLNKSDIKTSDDNVLTVNSPLVGVFYSSASPEADAYVAIGDRVKKGQVIGIVEAMKLMNEIESDYDGVVTDILVDNEQMVEYGQPMFVIKPV
ncbi:MAG: acetyl-CoA carboxylase biotin carboxyl carrier protein [Lachnospira sp.]